MSTIEEGLYKYLSDASVASGRVYPVKAPQNVAKPYVVLSKASGERTHALVGPVGHARPRFRIHIFDSTYKGVKDVSNQIRHLLDGYSGLMGTVTVKACSLITEIDLYEDDTYLHHNVLDFLIGHTEA